MSRFRIPELAPQRIVSALVDETYYTASLTYTDAVENFRVEAKGDLALALRARMRVFHRPVAARCAKAAGVQIERLVDALGCREVLAYVVK